MEKIEWSPPDISEEDNQAMKKVIDSGWLSEGKITQEFESMLAKYIGCKHAIVVNNATAALLTVLWANDFKQGDEIIVPAYTFIATVNTPMAVGCVPMLTDCNLETMNSEPGFMEPKLTKKTRAIIPVDIAGMPIDLDAFKEFAKENDLVLIEDAAESFGAQYRGKRIGSFGHATIFSFHIAKLITSIEGGCIATNDDAIADKCRMIKNHGTLKKVAKTNFFNFGVNFRTTDLQSALGLSQLKRAEEFLALRNRISRIYMDELNGIVGFQEVPKHVSKHGRMFFPIFVEELKRNEIDEELNKQGVSTRICWPPAHKQPFHSKLFPNQSYPNSEKIGNTIITLPLGNKTSEEDAKKVAEIVKKTIAGVA
jgi:perosamine synthetase